jgi:hypothetical protein
LIFGIWGKVRTRGTHVNTAEIGSRGAVFCFGGILGIYAELRRELVGRSLDLIVFWSLGGVSTWGGEEGGQLCVFLCSLVCQSAWEWGSID